MCCYIFQSKTLPLHPEPLKKYELIDVYKSKSSISNIWTDKIPNLGMLIDLRCQLINHNISNIFSELPLTIALCTNKFS